VTLETGTEHSITFLLNTAFQGGTSYPVLTAVLGAATGLASTPAGLFFSTASTAVEVKRSVHRILGRTGDEIWQLEEIGKMRDNDAYKAVHINSYWLVDPYRSRHNAQFKGWLIHEERTYLTLE